MQLSLSLAWKYTWKGTAWGPFYILYIVELSPSKTTIHWISRYTRNREYFGTRWKRGKVLCVYSKHNNGKARSREDHGASPSLWKEYYRKTRQTIQVGSGNLHVEAFLQVKKLMEKTYSGTEQNMSEKQGKGQIMLHLPMKFENHVMNRENEFLRSWSGCIQVR